MRVSNDTQRTAFLTALAQMQRRIADTQAQVGTGKRFDSPSQDPIAAARVAHLEAALSRIEQFQANGTVARHQLALEEETLGAVIDHLQRIRELALRANRSSNSLADREIIAAEIRQARDALVALGNTTDVDGRHLFGGYGESGTPFSIDGTGAVVYNGDQGQRLLQISEARFIVTSDSGAEIFQKMTTGNGTFTLAASVANTGTGVLGAGTVVDAGAYVPDTYTIRFLTSTTYEVRDGANVLVGAGTFAPPDQSIAFLGADVQLSGSPATGDEFTLAPSAQRDMFTTVADLGAAIGSSAAGPAARARMHGDIAQRLVDLDQALAHVIDARAEIGARARAIDQEEALGQEFAVHLADAVSKLRDVDYAEALSRLSQQMFGLEAAQQSFARTQGLSLFEYL